MQDTEHCINCNTVLTGKYCHNCGQKKLIKRITVRTLIEDFTSKWLGWDNKFLRTVKGLTVSPEKVVNAYIDGIRVNYVGPIGYAFLTTTIMILLYSWLGLDIKEMLESSQELMGQNANANRPEVNKYIESLNATMSNNYRFLIMAMIPFIALSGIMFYSNDKLRKTNYLEQCVLYFYLAGHTVWFSILSIFILKFGGMKYSWIVSPISIIYTLFGIYSFQSVKGIKGILKAMFCYLTGFLIFMCFAMIITVIYIVFFTDMIQTIIDNTQNAKGS